MAVPVHVPRVNNNDDEVKLIELKVAVGDKVGPGQIVAVVETDKAVVDVESPSQGFVLALHGELQTMVTVGKVLLWLGESADEKPPAAERAEERPRGAEAGSAQPTAKARALLAAHGLSADEVPVGGDRLTADDVERYVATRGNKVSKPSTRAAAAAGESLPEIAGTLKPLRSDQRGMLLTVTWHRDVAVPGYIEIAFDQKPWEDFAAAFQQRHDLLLNPMLPLMAWRLVTLAADQPRLNATIAGEQRLEFDAVNLGFTVQAGEVLYLVVTRDAAGLGELGFVQQLIELQRRAAGHLLGPAETTGATIGFSSMARWKVGRHIPVLAPHTALMVAHAVDASGQAVLGATYDHRVLHGADVVAALRKLAKPPALD